MQEGEQGSKPFEGSRGGTRFGGFAMGTGFVSTPTRTCRTRAWGLAVTLMTPPDHHPLSRWDAAGGKLR